MGLRTFLGLKKPPPQPISVPWFDGKDFTHDVLHRKLQPWIPALAHLRNCESEVLELGTSEGRSAVAFLECLPNSRVTTVDHFPNAEVEARARRNLAEYGERVRIVKGEAISVLDQFMRAGERFDAIYLDAGKRRAPTFAQSSLAFPLLKVGGIMIWDDLRWKSHLPASERPGPAIELFAKTFRSCVTELHRDLQLIVKKTAEWPGG